MHTHLLGQVVDVGNDLDADVDARELVPHRIEHLRAAEAGARGGQAEGWWHGPCLVAQPNG